MTRAPRSARCIVATVERAALSEGKSSLYCVIKASPARPSVCLCLYFIFQSQAIWCNCSKGTIWYFGFFFFFFFWVGGVSISFVPQGLSEAGRLHTENVRALHARDHRRFSFFFFFFIPVMMKKGKKEKKKQKTRNMGRKKKERNIYIQFATAPKTLRTSLSARSVRLPPRASSHLCALQISALVRLLFVILFCARVRVCVCVRVRVCMCV